MSTTASAAWMASEKNATNLGKEAETARSLPVFSDQYPQASNSKANRAIPISVRALAWSSHQSSLYQGRFTTGANGAWTWRIAGGKGLGTRQKTANSAIE